MTGKKQIWMTTANVRHQTKTDTYFKE